MGGEFRLRLKPISHYLGLDHDEFLLQFRSHPDFPSALSLNDTINNFGIITEAFEVFDTNDYSYPKNFVTIIDDHFTLVEYNQKNDLHKIYRSTKSTKSVRKISDENSNLVISLPNISKVRLGKSIFALSSYTSLLYAFLIVVFAISSAYSNPVVSVYNFFSLIGIILSAEIYKLKVTQHSSVVNKICTSNKNSTQDTCAKLVLGDSKKILGLKLSDWSLIFFCSVFVSGTLYIDSKLFLFSASIISLAAVIYSLIYQLLIIREVCKVCMGINLILLLQILTVFRLYPVEKDPSLLIYPFLLVGFFTAIFFTVDRLLEENQKLKKEHLKNLKFKRSYEIFKNELLKTDRFIFQDNESFLIGPPDSPLKIQLITSPYCRHCHETTDIITGLINRFQEEISVQLRFTLLDDSSIDEFFGLMKILKKVYLQDSFSIFNVLDEWKAEQNIRLLKSKYLSSDELLKKVSMADIVKILDDNRSHNLNYTPVLLINGYKFPEKYEHHELKYFIHDLIKDKDVITQY